MKIEIEKQLSIAKIQLLQNDFLIIQTANECMEAASKLPPLSPIFGTLFQSGEIAILAGDTGLGKSILGVQIANAIAYNHDCILDQECMYKLNGNSSVLLLDFELGSRQFYTRYEGFQFSSKFLRAEFNASYSGDETLSFDLLNRHIQESNAEVIILDNISALALRSTQDADIAIQVMRGLKQLTRKGKSVLVMAHVPKIQRNIPLTNDHLAGSKYLSNFADSVFFIGQSNEDPDFRYIKQTKCRNAEIKREVIVASIERIENFLGFHMVRYDNEANHLSLNNFASEETLDNQKVQVIEYYKQGMSIREIATITRYSKSTVQRITAGVPRMGQNGTIGTIGTVAGTPQITKNTDGSEVLRLSHEEKGQPGTRNGTAVGVVNEDPVPEELSQVLSHSHKMGQ